MGEIKRFFECKNKDCEAKNKRWNNYIYQGEIQNCETCKRPTKAYRSIHSGKLFGRFKCERVIRGKICGSEWFSGNAYYNTWQKCLRCKNNCKPFYLKEHDQNGGVVTKRHPDHLCQKCIELKEETGNSFARCDESDDYSSESDDDYDEDYYWEYTNPGEYKLQNWFYTDDKVYLQAPCRLHDYKNRLESGSVKRAPSCDPYRKLYFLHLAMLAANKESSDKKKNALKNFNVFYTEKLEEKNKIEAPLIFYTERLRQRYETRYRKYRIDYEGLTLEKAKSLYENMLREIENDKKKAKNKREQKLREEKSKREKQAKKKKEEAKKKKLENWFYTADEIYPDAPFRLKDYRKMLDSGSVKEAPSCEPYRKLYFLHLEKLAAENQSDDKKKEAEKMFYKLYTAELREVANKKTKLAKKEAVSKTVAKTAPKDKTDDNKKKTNSSKKNQKNYQKKANNIDDNKENTTSAKTSKSQQNESSLEKKMAALTVSSSQKATRTSTSSRRVLTKLG